MISCTICKWKCPQQSNSFPFFTTKNRKMWCVIWPLKIVFFLQDELAQTSLPAWRSSPGKNSREFCNIFLQEDLLQVYHALSAKNTFEIQTCDEENLIKISFIWKFLYFPPWYKQRHLPKSNKILHPEKRKSWIIGLPFMNSDLSIYIVPF